MGILNNTADTEFIPTIGDEYNVGVKYSFDELYWPEVGNVGCDGMTIGEYIANKFRPIRDVNDKILHEGIKETIQAMLQQFFKRKHTNGLYKTFTYEFKKTPTGFTYNVRDNMRVSHIKITFCDKRYGSIIQKFKAQISTGIRQFCGG